MVGRADSTDSLGERSGLLTRAILNRTATALQPHAFQTDSLTPFARPPILANRWFARSHPPVAWERPAERTAGSRGAVAVRCCVGAVQNGSCGTCPSERVVFSHVLDSQLTNHSRTAPHRTFSTAIINMRLGRYPRPNRRPQTSEIGRCCSRSDGFKAVMPYVDPWEYSHGHRTSSARRSTRY